MAETDGTETSLLLRREQVAKLLEVHPKTVQRLGDSGKLAVVRLGRAVRYRRDQVERFVEEATASPAPGRSPLTARSATAGFDRIPKLEALAREKRRARDARP
jgi:excisionase family DNA binding protein